MVSFFSSFPPLLNIMRLFISIRVQSGLLFSSSFPSCSNTRKRISPFPPSFPLQDFVNCWRFELLFSPPFIGVGGYRPSSPPLLLLFPSCRFSIRTNFPFSSECQDQTMERAQETSRPVSPLFFLFFLSFSPGALFFFPVSRARPAIFFREDGNEKARSESGGPLPLFSPLPFV